MKKTPLEIPIETLQKMLAIEQANNANTAEYKELEEAVKIMIPSVIKDLEVKPAPAPETPANIKTDFEKITGENKYQADPNPFIQISADQTLKCTLKRKVTGKDELYLGQQIRDGDQLNIISVDGVPGNIVLWKPETRLGGNLQRYFTTTYNGPGMTYQFELKGNGAHTSVHFYNVY